MIIDDMLPQHLYDTLRKLCREKQYEGVVNPIDGVTYPGINTIVPVWLTSYWRRAVADTMAIEPEQITIQAQFFRLTTSTTPSAPHQAHNDISHAQYSSFYYINDKPEDVMAGTSILSHKDLGMEKGPIGFDEVRIAMEDSNDYDAWKIEKMFFWEANRCVYYPSELMHRAEPPGGWGNDASDGRLVLITFFSC